MMEPPVRPAYVKALEAAYGPPSQAAFGSAVFYAPGPATRDLAQDALDRYRYFVGDLWERYGADAWLGSWRQVYTRLAGAKGDIAAELRAIPDRGAAQAATLLLDEVEGAAAARQALAAAFDNPALGDLTVYTIGDGAAMSGILIAGRRADTGETIILIILLD